jgi:hypothetical protein
MKRNPPLRTQRPSIPPHVYETLLESVYSKILTHSGGRGGLISSTSGGRDLITEWDLIRRYARGDYLLTEGQWARGRLLLEGFIEGLSNAFSWVAKGAGKIATGAVTIGKKVIDVTKEAISGAGKALVWAFEKIPYAKEMYEIISDFTASIVSQIMSSVKEIIGDFKKWVLEKKDEILGALMKGLADEPSFIEALHEKAKSAAKDDPNNKKPESKKMGESVGGAMKDAASEELSQFVETFKKDPVGVGLQIIKVAGDSQGGAQISAARRVFGSIFSNGIKKILRSGGKAADRIFSVFSAGGLFESKEGMLVFKLMNLATSAGDSFQELAQNAIMLWNQIKKMGSNKLDIEHRGRTIKNLIPEIVYGLISGSSPLEGLLKDPAEYILKLFKNLLNDIRNALAEEITSKGKEEISSRLRIDPNGKTITAVFYVLKKMLGVNMADPSDQSDQGQQDQSGSTPAPAKA